jgi:hypothetical protein
MAIGLKDGMSYTLKKCFHNKNGSAFKAGKSKGFGWKSSRINQIKGDLPITFSLSNKIMSYE